MRSATGSDFDIESVESKSKQREFQESSDETEEEEVVSVEEERDDKQLINIDNININKENVKKKNAEEKLFQASIDISKLIVQAGTQRLIKKDSPETSNPAKSNANDITILHADTEDASGSEWIRQYTKDMNQVLGSLTQSPTGDSPKSNLNRATGDNKIVPCNCQQPKCPEPCERGGGDPAFAEIQQRRLDRDSAITCALVDVLFGVFGFIVIIGCLPFWFGICSLACACKKRPDVKKALCFAKIGMVLIPLTIIAFIVLALTMDGLLLEGQAWVISFFVGKKPGPAVAPPWGKQTTLKPTR